VIDLYTWTTPNGRKASIALSEMNMRYQVHPIDINQGDQFNPDFLRISPNNKIPAIVDQENGMRLMESGAILIYLAEKSGMFLPSSGERRIRTIEWLMWQMGGVGPMLGQLHHFMHYNKGKVPYAEERYHTETLRLYSVLDRRLADHEFVADEYSIADMAIWPWIARYEWHEIEWSDFPHIKRWYKEIAKRPAVVTGYMQPRNVGEIPIPD